MGKYSLDTARFSHLDLTMTNSNDRKPKRKDRRGLWPYPAAFVFVSLLAIVSTFILANSEFALAAKSQGFSAIIAGFLVVCVCIYLLQNRRTATAKRTDADSEAYIESRLLAFDEANEFFGGSLKPADMFRLVSSRVAELILFQTSALFLLDETRSQLRIAEAAGANSEDLIGKTIRFDESPAGKCYSSRTVEMDLDLPTDGDMLPNTVVKAVRTVVAIPLFRETDVFGILQLYFDTDEMAKSTDVSLFEAIGIRVAPMILSSIAFERSLSNALIDPTTDLGNERAFFLILENQIAESQRKRDERPLTILAIDIKNFDNINGKYGHASGDRVLKFVARIVKEQLRQMDFFVRASNDEFLAILPTASEQVSWEIIARIQTAFFGNRLKLTETDAVQIDLNYGSAAFWKDGETAEQLLNTSRLRKQQSKSSEPNKVLRFPKEFAN